jgi:hypothetical protein
MTHAAAGCNSAHVEHQDAEVPRHDTTDSARAALVELLDRLAHEGANRNEAFIQAAKLNKAQATPLPDAELVALVVQRVPRRLGEDQVRSRPRAIGARPGDGGEAPADAERGGVRQAPGRLPAFRRRPGQREGPRQFDSELLLQFRCWF